MVWVTIPNGDIDADSPVTVSLMTALRDNVAAAFAKDAGAPTLANGYINSAMMGVDSVNQSAIASNAVGQSELKSTTASQSQAVGASQTIDIALTGGNHTMGWYLGANGSTVQGYFNVKPNPSTYSATASVHSTDTGSNTAYLYSRYVQASPPYNLGDGDIPLFCYALVENGTGIILGTSFAKDPHWAYHGNHNITPDRIDNVTGKKYKNIPSFVADEFDFETAIMSGNQAIIDVALDKLKNKNITEIELTDTYKNQDMDITPHPWINEDLTNKTVVLLDPVSDMVLSLYEIHKQTEHSDANNLHLPNLLHNDYIRLNNKSLKRKMPSGVIAVTPKWKITK